MTLYTFVMAFTMFRSRATQLLAAVSRHVQTSASCQQAWKVGKLNHVAIACPDLDKATAMYRDVLHAKVSEKQALPSHGVTVVFVELGDTKIELLHPLGEKSPIQNFLDKNANGGMHHICLEVNDIEAAIKEVKSKNIRPLSEKPSTGAHGKPVVFLHPKDCNGVLVELEEVK
ncbi:ethylmalonyl-CoA/methylmalonyl-CoA epimerase-like [Babylonia areolata]|uniref:ethylmalonyl-CoA/methylmalonyl-CoA epimerase-like n=1 Tax=Babylonia areolata TaxID=304850 RepID=UPI003FD69996